MKRVVKANKQRYRLYHSIL